MKTTLLFTFLLVLLMASCKKDDNSPDGIHQPQDIEIYNNVKVIDSTSLVFNPTETNLNTGLYVYDVVDSPQIIQVNDVIIGLDNEGYIRKVTSANYNNSQVVLQTTPATLEDVFKQGDFNFSVGMDDLPPGNTADSFAYLLENYNLYDSESLNIQVDYANVSIRSSWLFDFSFDNQMLDYFKFATSEATFSSAAKVSVTALQATELLNRTDTLTTSSKKVVHWMDVKGIPVPVVLQLDLYWLSDYSGASTAGVTTAMEGQINGDFDLGVQYQNDTWNGLYSFSPNNIVSVEATNGRTNANFNIAFRPYLKVKLYGVEGPRASLALMEKWEENVSASSSDWDIKGEVWGNAFAGASTTILGNSLLDCPDQEWSSPKTSHQIPYKLIKASGYEQIGLANTSLPEPIKIQVLDSKDHPVGNVPVYFTVASGSGSTNPTEVLTDENGYAETSWLLGHPASTNMQYMSANAKFADGTALNDTPLEITAAIGFACGGQTSFTDPRDGQTYSVVQIGNQCWFAENLRYEGSIPEVGGPSDWEAIAHTPAWCYYDDSAAYNAIYGKIYNWYAVNSGSLCPDGWHIPTDEEWTILTDYLGGSNVGGGKMKSISGWNEPNANATNSSGFSGLPGGDRYGTGNFYGIGTYGCWWSATETLVEDAWSRGLIYSSGSVNRTFYTKSKGLSCRCVRD